MTRIVPLLRREEVAEGTVAFFFEKPAGFQFTAGQYLSVTLMDPPTTDAEGNTRALSLASAPCEGHLMIATRMRPSAFKENLKTMPFGSTVRIKGPFGSFTLHSDASRPAVFLIGGIGITPIRSMLVEAAHERVSRELMLIYSNHRPEAAAFLDELIILTKENPNITCSSITGHIDQALLAHHLPHLKGPIYYSAGPPEMVAAMRELLHNVGIDDADIRSEDFSGY